MTTTDYLNDVKDDNERIIIYIDNNGDTEQTNSYIGVIKHILDDGSIILAKSSKYNEVVIMEDKIISVRKWTEK